MRGAYCDISKAEYKKRIAKAKALLKEKDMDALLVTSYVNTYYFTGLDSLFVSLTGVEQDVPWALVIAKDAEPVFLLPSYFKNPFEAGAWTADLHTYPAYWEALPELKKLWHDMGLEGSRVGAELSHSQLMHSGILFELEKKCEFVDATKALANARMVKTTEEMSRLRNAGIMSNRGFEKVLPKIKAGMTERDVGRMLYASFVDEGCDRTYYIEVRGADRYDLPLMLPTDRKLRVGDWVKVSWGGDYRHYINEAKQYLIVGKQPSSKMKDLNEVFVEALKKGVRTCRPGATCPEVYEAQKHVFDEAGMKVKPFRMGHGTGLEAHEPPDVRPGDNTVIRAGMTLAIEPWDSVSAYGLSNTVIVKPGSTERLPPLMEEIITV